MKHLLILLTGMNCYAACSLIRTRNILSSVGPTRSCWPTREPSPSFCKLTPRKTTHPTHQVTRAAILDIRREGWVISKKQNILRAYLYRTKNNAHDHCRKKKIRARSASRKKHVIRRKQFMHTPVLMQPSEKSVCSLDKSWERFFHINFLLVLENRTEVLVQHINRLTHRQLMIKRYYDVMS